MNPMHKKELKTQWLERKPDMGILAITCNPTGETFLVISKDTTRGFNRHRFQLSASMHPNKKLQALWNQYGEENFTSGIAKPLKYDDPAEDHTKELEALLEQCLAENENAEKL